MLIQIQQLMSSQSLALDLPQPYSKPTAALLLNLLTRLKLQPINFSGENDGLDSTPSLEIQGSITPWLTSLIKSPLAWISDDSDRDAIWNAAAARLAERAGSMGQSSLQRKIRVPATARAKTSVASQTDNDNCRDVRLTLNEPAITSDHLGTKTWGSAYTLACALPALAVHVPGVVLRSSLRDMNIRTRSVGHQEIPRLKVLELGAGTGLVGLAAAALWWVDVDLTDLEGVVLENLR